MANNIASTALATGVQVVTLDTTGSVKLPCPSDTKVSRWVLHVIFNGVTPGAFVPELSIFGTGVDLTADTVECAYYKVSTGSTAITAGTATSAVDQDIYVVPCDGCELTLNFTAATHSLTVYAMPLLG
ncbi:MAG: hypothetical protein IPK85_03315 [Gemmatimonadetes bacterium]|nr:hypothetical protein [Gemmatimonadota bacterium]